MAGDWLKMEHSTPDKPEVLAITVRMGWDDPDLTVGKLFKMWRWFDQHTVDGNAHGVTSSLLDRLLGVSGFTLAVASVGWLEVNEAGISLVNFDRHNGNTAKNRAQTAKRVAKHKSNGGGNAQGNGDSVTSALPREEKRREEGIETPPSVARRTSTGQKTLTTYLAECKQSGVKPVPDDHYIRDYCRDAGITTEMASIAWLRFREDHTVGTRKAKRYTDWPAAFANSIKDRWYRLWVVNADGEANWTNEGLQARRVIEAQVEAAA